jgi:hypothetical protein
LARYCLTVVAVILSLVILTLNFVENVPELENGPLMLWILIRVSPPTQHAWIGPKKMAIQTRNVFYATDRFVFSTSSLLENHFYFNH